MKLPATFPADSRQPMADSRSGVILMVVLVLLTLFAVVAVTFVFYSESQTVSAQFFIEAQNRDRPTDDLLLSFLLSQLIYGTNDTRSALIGQSLLENMYGQYGQWWRINPGEVPYPVVPYNPAVLLTPGQLRDVNLNGVIDFADLNYKETSPFSPNFGLYPNQFPANAPLARDNNINGVIDPGDFDLIYPFIPGPPPLPNPSGWADGADNDMNGAVDDIVDRSGNFPFNGTGKLTLANDPSIPGQPSYFFINFQDRYVAGNRLAVVGPNISLTPVPTAEVSSVLHPQRGAFNPPYTYPDHNAPFLGAITKDGAIIARSFVRSVNNNNPYQTVNWGGLSAATPAEQAAVIRPLPILQARGPQGQLLFPMPEDQGGDVRNVHGVRGAVVSNLPSGAPIFARNDSYWFDPNFPVQTGPDGKRYKPLYAIFVMDLNGKLDVNEHFNALGQTQIINPAVNITLPGHLSNLGVGPHEVAPPPLIAGVPPRPELVLFSVGLPAAVPPVQPEYGNLLRGARTSAQRPLAPLSGRFQDTPGGTESPVGPFAVPGRPGQDVPGALYLQGPFYSRADFNARRERTASRSDPLSMPGQSPAARLWYCFPSYHPENYFGPAALGFNYANPPIVADSRVTTNPPFDGSYDNCNALGIPGPFPFPPFWPVRRNHPALYNSFGSTSDRRFEASHLEFLYRMGDTNTDAHSSDIANLCPNSFSQGGLGNALRWLLTTHTSDRVNYGHRPLQTEAYPLQKHARRLESMTYPSTYWPANQPAPVFSPQFSGQRFDWLNKPFIPYPRPNANGSMNTTLDVLSYPQGTLAANGRPDYLDALLDRQDRAKQIYVILQEIVGGGNPSRQLAQLAVNIVDYLDPDDFHTPFRWNNAGPASQQWVFGTELPRLVLNESYIEYDNDPAMMGANLTVKAWVELLNPLARDAQINQHPLALPQTVLQRPLLTQQGEAWLRLPPDSAQPPVFPDPALPMTPTPNGPYRVVLAQGVDPNDPTGAPVTPYNRPGGAGLAEVKDFTNPNPNIINPTIINPSIEPKPNEADGNFSGDDPNDPNDLIPDPMDADFATYQKGPMRGWFLLGPSDLPKDNMGMGNVVPQIPKSTLQNPGMTCEVPRAPAGTPGGARLTLVLQRLACPHLPEDNNPLLANGQPNPAYNPFLTIDYMETFESGWNDTSGMGTAPQLPPLPPTAQAPYKIPRAGAVDQRRALGRNQPYAAHVSGQMFQSPDMDPLPNSYVRLPRQPQHTFFRHNYEYSYGRYATPAFQETPDPVATAPASDPTNPYPTPTLKLPFDWLIHLDRPLLNPLELLHVCGPSGDPAQMPNTVHWARPCDLTQRFMFFDDVNVNGQWDAGEQLAPFQHLAPWFDPNFPPTNPPNANPLYRFLEFVETRPLSQWSSLLSRRSGKINLNTTWDQEVPEALIDLPTTPLLTPQVKQRFWDDLRLSRDNQQPNQISPILGNLPVAGGPSKGPFWNLTGLGNDPLSPMVNPGQVQPGEEHYLRPRPNAQQTATRLWGTDLPRLLEFINPNTNQPLFTHPYERAFIMSKISNNLTTRSNVFAVWVTVGFFEVHSQLLDPARPYDPRPIVGGGPNPAYNPYVDKLGAEIGRADGQHRRHRFFAVVDRSVFERYLAPAAIGFNPYAKYDPRRDYSSIQDPILGQGPPAGVLHWTIIE